MATVYVIAIMVFNINRSESNARLSSGPIVDITENIADSIKAPRNRAKPMATKYLKYARF